jgi:hypothetical protein
MGGTKNREDLGRVVDGPGTDDKSLGVPPRVPRLPTRQDDSVATELVGPGLRRRTHRGRDVRPVGGDRDMTIADRR